MIESIGYQANVVLDFPNQSPDACPDILGARNRHPQQGHAKPLQKNFAFELEYYNIYNSISRSVINEEIVKKGF